MEKVEIDITDIFDDKMEMLIDEYCERYKVDDLRKESQNTFNGCLMYIARRVFKNTNLLKYNPNINNEYNIDKVKEVLEYYINLCNIYSKEISINGFSKLTGIEYQTILYWGQEPSSKGFEIYKTLIKENEQSNSDLLATSPRTIGIVARLNHVHGWNMPGVTKETSKREQVQIATAQGEFEKFKLEMQDTTDK